MEYKININRDSDACVWVATSSDVSGIVLECPSYDMLIERVRYAVPEMLELNGKKAEDYELVFCSEMHDRLPALPTARYDIKVKQKFSASGIHFVRHGRGFHDVWYSPATNTNVTVDDKIRSRFTANEIMKQCGIDHKFR